MAPETDGTDEKRFLLELQRMTNGDPDIQVSMFDVGATLNLDKSLSGKLAEELIGRGWAAIKTLSGGIGITPEGQEAAQAAGGGGSAEESALRLEGGPILTQRDRQTLEKAVDRVKGRIPELSLPFERLEEMVIDIKTMETQLLSPRAKTGVIKALLRALQASLETSGADDEAGMIKGLIGN